MPARWHDAGAGKANGLLSHGNTLVVSVLGDTGVGKSTLVSAMLSSGGWGDNHRSASSPEVGDMRAISSTTAGVNLFCVRGLGQNGMILLDCEGFNAGTAAPLDARDKPWASEGSEAMEKRNKIVATQIPRIAFSASNTIILVTEHNWQNGLPWKQGMSFVKRACRGIRDANRLPLLIIVSTDSRAKAQELAQGGPDQLTSSFLENHDPTGQRVGLFRDVRCVSLTNFSRGTDVSDEAREAYKADVAQLVRDISDHWTVPYV